MIVIRWYALREAVFCCRPGCDPPPDAAFLGVTVVGRAQFSVLGDILASLSRELDEALYDRAQTA